MSLKSFPKDKEQRRTIWVLEQSDIQKISENVEHAPRLLNPKVLVVQHPVSEFAKRRSPELRDMCAKGIIQPNALLLEYTDSEQNIKSEYIELEAAVISFLDESLQRGLAYCRFFAALGASEILIKNSKEADRNQETKTSASVEGSLSPKMNSEFEYAVESRVKEIMHLSQKCSKNKNTPEERVNLAERILEEESMLKNDVKCLSLLKQFRDETDIKEFEVALSHSSSKKVDLAAALAFKKELPIISETKGCDSISKILDIKAKLDLAEKATQQIDSTLKILFFGGAQ